MRRGVSPFVSRSSPLFARECGIAHVGRGFHDLHVCSPAFRSRQPPSGPVVFWSEPYLPPNIRLERTGLSLLVNCQVCFPVAHPTSEGSRATYFYLLSGHFYGELARASGEG